MRLSGSVSASRSPVGERVVGERVVRATRGSRTLWRRHQVHGRPIFAYQPEIRKLLYTSKAIESLHAQFRRRIAPTTRSPTTPSPT